MHWKGSNFGDKMIAISLVTADCIWRKGAGHFAAYPHHVPATINTGVKATSSCLLQLQGIRICACGSRSPDGMSGQTMLRLVLLAGRYNVSPRNETRNGRFPLRGRGGLTLLFAFGVPPRKSLALLFVSHCVAVSRVGLLGVHHKPNPKKHDLRNDFSRWTPSKPYRYVARTCEQVRTKPRCPHGIRMASANPRLSPTIFGAELLLSRAYCLYHPVLIESVCHGLKNAHSVVLFHRDRRSSTTKDNDKAPKRPRTPSGEKDPFATEFRSAVHYCTYCRQYTV